MVGQWLDVFVCMYEHLYKVTAVCWDSSGTSHVALMTYSYLKYFQGREDAFFFHPTTTSFFIALVPPQCPVSSDFTDQIFISVLFPTGRRNEEASWNQIPCNDSLTATREQLVSVHTQHLRRNMNEVNEWVCVCLYACTFVLVRVVCVNRPHPDS